MTPERRNESDEREELNRLRTAMARLNRLRSNIVNTQSASWSNTTYPLVAILNAAGYELEGATDGQREEHIACYGGAGRWPLLLDHTPPPENLVGTTGLRREGRDQDGSLLIHQERWRQIEAEGWTPEHDDEHNDTTLVDAAVSYALMASVGQRDPSEPPEGWPWERAAWKPSDDPIRNLVKAGALIAAEIDRLQRATNAQPAASVSPVGKTTP